MNTEKNETPKSAGRPSWMNESHQGSWVRIKQTLTTEFAALQEKVEDGALKVEDRIAAKALEFGHAARAAFDKLGEWGKDVDDHLKPEWHKFDAAHSWERVVTAVKFGFQHKDSSPQALEEHKKPVAEQKSAKPKNPSQKSAEHKGPTDGAKI